MFYIYEFIFNILPIFFIFVLGIIIFGILKNISIWNKNNNSPKLSVVAKIVSKRSDVNVHHNRHMTGTNVGVEFNSLSSTSYYVTFEVESGDRMEFLLRGKEYGMLSEGDIGILSFQGTRYLDFKRE